MTPAHEHISLLLWFKAGRLPINTVGAPATHGPAGIGMQGIGVSTPSAAAVAAITIGFDGLAHRPNGGTLTMGAKSMMVAAGVPVRTRLAGNTTSVDGAAPKLHCMTAPAQTWHPMLIAPVALLSLQTSCLLMALMAR